MAQTRARTRSQQGPAIAAPVDPEQVIRVNNKRRKLAQAGPPPPPPPPPPPQPLPNAPQNGAAVPTGPQPSVDLSLLSDEAGYTGNNFRLIGLLDVDIPDDLMEYISDYHAHPTGRLRERIATMITTMIDTSGMGDETWLRPMPLSTFLIHWSEDFAHPWDNSPWLDRACQIYREGATEQELEEFAQLYEDAKSLATPATAENPGHSVFIPIVKGADLSLPRFLASVRVQLWNFANNAVDFHTDVTDPREEIKDQVDDYRPAADIAAGTYPSNPRPIRIFWEFLWQNARRRFEDSGPDVTERDRFNALFDGAYDVAFLCNKHQFPPKIPAQASSTQICNLVEAVRQASLQTAARDWDQGNVLVKNPDGGFTGDSDVVYLQRREAFRILRARQGFTGWGYGPRDEAARQRNMTACYNAYIARMNVELRADAAVRKDKIKLHILKTRYNIEMLVPHWRLDMTATDYLVNVLKPALFDAAIISDRMDTDWSNAKNVARAEGHTQSAFERQIDASYTGMLSLVQANPPGAYPYGPEHAALIFRWDAIALQLPNANFQGTRLRFDDLRDDVLEIHWRYDDIPVDPLAVQASDTSMEIYCDRASRSRRTALERQCYSVWDAAIAALLAGPARNALRGRFNTMKEVYNRFGHQALYRPGDDDAVLPEHTIAGRRLEPTAARGAPAGTWRYVGFAGQGSYGHCGVWSKAGDQLDLTERIIIKETYMTYNWHERWVWEGSIANRLPMEYHIVTSLRALTDSFNIVNYLGYGIYESMKMHRIYMEFCERGSLADMIDAYKNIHETNETDQNGNPLQRRIPPRVLWAMFEGMASALYLMQKGSLPGTVAPAVPSVRALHRDIKPANIFLSEPDNQFWRGIPVLKMGDFGLSVPLTSNDLQSTGVGTRGYRAPEAVTYPAGHEFENHGFPISGKSDVWVIGRVMLSLMNRERGPPEMEFGSDPPVARINSQATTAFYPATLRDLVDRCLQPDTTVRIGIEELRREIHYEVASYSGLTGPTMKSDVGPAGEIIRYKPDTFLQWAPPLDQ